MWDDYGLDSGRGIPRDVDDPAVIVFSQSTILPTTRFGDLVGTLAVQSSFPLDGIWQFSLESNPFFAVNGQNNVIAIGPLKLGVVTLQAIAYRNNKRAMNYLQIIVSPQVIVIVTGSLDFSDPKNSMYAPLLAGFP
jgi:hypothetical protein